MATKANRRTAVKDFVKRWTGRGDEIGEYQIFWIDLIQTLFDVPDGTKYFEFQKRVPIEHTKFIDAYIPSTKVLIEQKSIGIDLSAPNRQSGDRFLTPYEQAKQYAGWMKKSEQPDYIVTCNFEEFRIYDMEEPKADPIIIKLENLERSYGSLLFLLEKDIPPRPPEEEISFKAGKIVGELYDAFAKEYVDPNSKETLHSLNVLCVRLVFCLYAEDADIFERDLFYRYMSGWDTAHMRQALIALFKVLDTPPEKRSPYEPALNAFPYVNGGLFSDENILIPAFTEEIRELLLTKASANFDWSGINPTIFGAVFESTLNPVTRRKGGMHYTSIENIHKVIDPLFLDDLGKEFIDICKITVRRTKKTKLQEFQKKLASLTFLDPACGSGNFLTETYLCLRRLENDVLRELSQGQISFGDENWSPIQVSISQFYGIEINDFAVTVAKTALWIAESQMIAETENIVLMHIDFLPLKTNANIVLGNALRIDWEKIVPKSKLSYIMGNPPFSAGRRMGDKQRQDMIDVAYDFPKNGELDYVCLWYIVAARYMKFTRIKAGFVSTSSITQGEQVILLWKILFEKYQLNIIYAVRSFKWTNKARTHAGVHCVIIEFVVGATTQSKYICDARSSTKVSFINGYLTDNENTWIAGRNIPICSVPQISNGSKPLDNAICAFTPKEKDDFIKKEPESEPYFYKYMGSKEFINNIERYFLLINRIPTHLLIKMPNVLQKLEEIRKYRSESPSAATRALAENPAKFHFENIPEERYLVIPQTSSGRRRYIPIGFLSPDVIVNNKLQIMRNGGLYELGILSSNVHNTWIRTVAGQFREDFTYSISIVYNTFPWPNSSDLQKEKIKQTAQGILEAREFYSKNSLADMYGDKMYLFPELIKAHQQNDIAVMEAYGFKKGTPEFSSESACVAALMKMYQKLTAAKE